VPYTQREMGLLDLLWQKNLSTQLDETRYLFAGKTQHEKHLADREQALYQYARQLKDHVLPSPGVKIFLLHDSALRDYRRLKAQHYLLPHNVFNFGKLPRENSLQKGDYLLVLDNVGGTGLCSRKWAASMAQQASFSQRRKTLRNNLKGIIDADQLETLG
jgi:hypothetical protein